VELQKHKAIADVDAIAEKCQVVLAKICEEAKRQAQIYRVQKNFISLLSIIMKIFKNNFIQKNISVQK
jgi:PP-loop superfamily ATP-utilizing enzyme